MKQSKDDKKKNPNNRDDARMQSDTSIQHQNC